MIATQNLEAIIYKQHLTINIPAKHNLSFNTDSHKLYILIDLKIADLQPIV